MTERESPGTDMYRMIFELSPEAIVLIDKRGRFLAANGRLQDWLGYAPDELVGTSLLRAPFMPRPSKMVIVRNFLRRMAGKDIAPYELAFTTKAGEVRYGRVHATRVTDSEGRAFGDLVVISDVSELRVAQESLLHRSNELAKRVNELVCLHEISKLAMYASLSLDEFLMGVVELLPPALQHSDRAEARITLGGKTFETERFRGKLPSLSSEVMCEGEVIGRVEVCYARGGPEENQFLHEEQVLIKTVAERVGHMVARGRVARTLAESRRKIEGLHGAARRLAQSDGRDQACRVTIDAARDVLGFPVCIAHMAVGDSLIVRTACSDLPPGIEPEQTTPEGSAAMKAHKEGRTVVSVDGSTDAPASCPMIFRSSVCVPIEGAGVFEVLSPDENAFDDEDVKLLELLLGHTRGALRSIAMREELEQQAVRDPLTGLYNRRYLTSIVDQEVERARRYGHRIGFLMVDVDHFKEINDALGHQLGDLVLRQVSRYLRAMVRATELVIRYGGDEFLVVMPESDGDGTSVIARLQRSFGQWSDELPTGEIPLRLSMGYDVWEPASGRPVDEVIASADDRMYEDKRLHAARRSAVSSEAEQ